MRLFHHGHGTTIRLPTDEEKRFYKKWFTLIAKCFGIFWAFYLVWSFLQVGPADIPIIRDCMASGNPEWVCISVNRANGDYRY